MNTIDINSQFQDAFTRIETTDANLFITGKAGTGKSTFLTYFREKTTKKTVVLAPTGVSALNVKGETIHSFFWFDPKITIESAISAAKKRKNNTIFKELDVIIIDEISMVRADLLDCMDVYLKTSLKNEAPFGGKQIVFIGDLYQLPPVVTSAEKKYFEDVYESPYFFSSTSFTQKDVNMSFIELKKVYRQQDDHFIEILNAVRTRTVTSDHINTLNKHHIPNCEEHDIGYVYLTSTNASADIINASKLEKILAPDYRFSAIVSGKFTIKPPTDRHLVLKVGAQVMFLNNDAAGRWVNGTIGTLTEIDDDEDEIGVTLPNGKTVSVHPHKWDLSKYIYDRASRTLTQESIGSFTQYPLRLSWAMTIHKSQGKTFDNVIIDLERGSFATGQTYVALSRCRSLEGLRFKHPIKKSHILLDGRIVTFLTGYADQRHERLSLPRSM